MLGFGRGFRGRQLENTSISEPGRKQTLSTHLAAYGLRSNVQDLQAPPNP